MEQTNVRIVVYFDGATPYRESEVTRKDAVYVSRVPQIGEVLVLHTSWQPQRRLPAPTRQVLRFSRLWQATPRSSLWASTPTTR